MNQFELLKPQIVIPVISPAFRWAQSLTTVYLEVKFATRFDSPACLDLSEHEYKISEDGQWVNISAMCTNDKKLLHYKLSLKLNDAIMPQELDPDSPEAQERKEQIRIEDEKIRIEKEELAQKYKENEENLKKYWEETNPGEEWPGVEAAQAL